MSNINIEEIQKFSALADHWWDLNGPMKPLHQLNPLRLSYIERHTTLSEKNVLDIGCGAGILTEALAKAGAKTTGIDLSDAAIHAAKNHSLKNKLAIDYRCVS